MSVIYKKNAGIDLKTIQFKNGRYTIFFKDVPFKDQSKLVLLPQTIFKGEKGKQFTEAEVRIESVLFNVTRSHTDMPFVPDFLEPATGLCDMTVTMSVSKNPIPLAIMVLMWKAVILVLAGIGVYLSLTQIDKIVESSGEVLKIGGGLPLVFGLGLIGFSLWKKAS